LKEKELAKQVNTQVSKENEEKKVYKICENMIVPLVWHGAPLIQHSTIVANFMKPTETCEKLL